MHDQQSVGVAVEPPQGRLTPQDLLEPGIGSPDELAQLIVWLLSDMAARVTGQVWSMDAGDLLPPQLRDILSCLHADAAAMPMSQLIEALDANWGKGWDRHFRRFAFTLLAAASIGQVNLAETNDGRRPLLGGAH